MKVDSDAYSFDTEYVRPARFRFEIKDEDDERSLIFVNGQDLRTLWDVEPGIQEPESLEIVTAQAICFTGGDVGRIPAMLMPQRLGGWVKLDLIDPKPIEDGELQNIECFRFEYSFRDEHVTLWIDKQFCLVRRIDERIQADDVRIERTTTYDPTIDGKITDRMLEFDPPAPRAADDSANTLQDSGLGEPAEAAPASVGSGATADPVPSPNAKPVSECEAIQVALRKHFMDKHPLFAASVNQPTKILSDLRKLGDMETRRQIGELAINSPVSEVINSFPGKPYVIFTEVTRASRDEVNVVSENVFHNADGTCRIEVTQKERKKLAGETIANGKPITEEEVRKLVRWIAKDSDFTQLQGDWESVSVTKGGKQIATEDGFAGLLLQIKGNTFVIAERTTNGETPEVDTGRIEINITSIPKTIDFIGSAELRRGIYELKDDLLRICLIEPNGTDAPEEKRVTGSKTLKRPIKFESPADSNVMLMEFRPMAANELKNVSQLMRQAN